MSDQLREHGSFSSDSPASLTAQIVTTYVKTNVASPDQVMIMARDLFITLSGKSPRIDKANATVDPTEPDRPTRPQQPDVEVAATRRKPPAVDPQKSVFPDYLICLEDGKEMKMLRRYLQTNYNMTSEEYRQKWGLGPNYPMVAPNYAKTRSRLAKEAGLGRRPGSHNGPKAVPDAEPAATASEETASVAKVYPEGVSGLRKTRGRRAA
jgi:predicted transcriptional regulator